jgi:hypothetical protein
VLEKAHQRFPGDRAILQALATMARDRGDRAKALAYAEQLVAAAPDDPNGQALLKELRR